jgi:hypothetical protein
VLRMEQHTLKNGNNCLNTNIYSYLETSGGQSSNPYLNLVHFLNTGADYKSVAAVFLHWCLICVVPLFQTGLCERGEGKPS